MMMTLIFAANRTTTDRTSTSLQMSTEFYNLLAGYPLRGNHQCRLICMKYKIIFLIIIIISLGQILLSYIANTSRTHARTDARTHARIQTRTNRRAHTPARAHTHTHRRRSGYRYSMSLWHPTVSARSAGDNGWSLAIEINIFCVWWIACQIMLPTFTR